MTSVFLSYARSDDERFVRRLQADLTAAGFEVWFDKAVVVTLILRKPSGDLPSDYDYRLVRVGEPDIALWGAPC